MRADSAVEPTKSENITVTWRRSAVSRGETSTATVAPTASMQSGQLRRCWLSRAEFAAMAKQDTELLQVLIRQIGQDAVVYRVIAKRGLVLLKAKAP